MSKSNRPGEHECFDYHRDYVAKVPDGDILKTLGRQAITAVEFMKEIPVDELDVIHPPYGWKIRTVLEHCCDAERVFGYRALRFAAGDKTDLPGWNQDQYADSGYGNRADAQQLADEFKSLRTANLCLLNRLDESGFDRIGTADGRKVSVRTFAWLMAGHWIHHHEVMAKRLGRAVEQPFSQSDC